MQRQRIPMTVEDYHLLEQPFGYKVEYWDGHTVSRRWHQAFGFVDVYDQMYIRLKHAWYRNEIWRRTKLGLMDGLDALAKEQDCWYAQLDERWRY